MRRLVDYLKAQIGRRERMRRERSDAGLCPECGSDACAPPRRCCPACAARAIRVA